MSTIPVMLFDTSDAEHGTAKGVDDRKGTALMWRDET